MPLDLPALNATCAAFDAAVPVGSWVRAWLPDFGPLVTTTRSPATLLGSGKIVVWLENAEASVAITAVERINPPAPEALAVLTSQRPWTATDDRELLAARLRGRSFRQIGEALGRGAPACEERYQDIRRGVA
jgi:hypothetical protein